MKFNNFVFNFLLNQEKLKQEMQTVKVSQIMEFCCCFFFAGGCSTINTLHSSISSRVH